MESSLDNENKIPTKTPRQRAVRKSTSVTEAPKRRVARSSVSNQEIKAEATEPLPTKSGLGESNKAARKAPTPISDNKIAKKAANRRKLVVLVLLILGIGASAMVGFTDQGQIDVVKTIEDRNSRIRNNSADARDVITSNVEVPVQNTNKMPDGGLVGRGTGGLPPAVKAEDISSSTATSTEMASTTEEIASSTEAQNNESETNTGEVTEVTEPTL